MKERTEEKKEEKKNILKIYNKKMKARARSPVGRSLIKHSQTKDFETSSVVKSEINRCQGGGWL